MQDSYQFQDSLPETTHDRHILICCVQHPALPIDYIFQREGEILQLGCFECVKSGALFFNSSHFLFEVEKFLQHQSSKKRRANAEHFPEIASLLQLIKQSQETKRPRKLSGWVSQELKVFVKLIQFFEINEETYDLDVVKHSGGNFQFPLKKMIKKYDMEDSVSLDRSICSENCEDHLILQQDEDSDNLSSSSILNGVLREDDAKNDYQNDYGLEDDDFDLELIGECMGVKQQFKLMIKELRRKAISNALYLCQHPHCQLFIKMDMTWKQFKQYARSYVFENVLQRLQNERSHGFKERVKQTKKELFYHIYTEDSTDIDLTEISTEYERRYQPIKVMYTLNQQQLFKQNLRQLDETQLSGLEKLAQVQRQEMIGEAQEDGERLFHECSECSCLVQETDLQAISIHQIFKQINLIHVFRTFIANELTFSPLQIFWDLRIDV